MSDLSQNMVQGNLKDFEWICDRCRPGTGCYLIGVLVGDQRAGSFPANVSQYAGWADPLDYFLTLVGVFSSGLYDYDSGWVYVPMETAQRLIAADR